MDINIFLLPIFIKKYQKFICDNQISFHLYFFKNRKIILKKSPFIYILNFTLYQHCFYNNLFKIMHNIQVEFVPKLKFAKKKKIQSRHQTKISRCVEHSRINYADQWRDPPTFWFVKIMFVTP